MEASRDNRDFINLGPCDTSMLRLQHSYRSQVVWNEPQDAGIITCRRSIGVLRGHVIDDRLIPYFHASRFYVAI